MKLHVIAAVLAATFMVGCTKCSQQPTPETAPPPTEMETETAPVDPAAPTEGATGEEMPNTDQMNEELPPEPAGQ